MTLEWGNWQADPLRKDSLLWRALRSVGSPVVLRPRPFPETRASMLSAMRGTEHGGSAWREFFACYAPPVFRVACKHGLTRDDAEDIVQQVMINVSRHIKNFRYDRDRGRFRSWVQSITANKVRDRLRMGVRRHEQASVPFEEDRGDGADLSEETLWAQEWLLQDTLWCLEQVRDEIAPHRYEAFRLYAIEGLPADEVAKQVGMTKGHVYVTRSQIAKRIRQLMSTLDGASGAHAPRKTPN